MSAIYEFVFTSSPLGIGGSSGFCGVAKSENLPKAMESWLGRLSGYSHLHKPGSAKNPVNYSYVSFQNRGQLVYAFSCVRDAGLDYTQRSNKLAHHLLSLTPQVGDPSLILKQYPFEESWTANRQPELRATDIVLHDNQAKPQVCNLWKNVAGDAGFGGMVAAKIVDKNISEVVIGYRDGDLLHDQSILNLLHESISLLPSRDRWKATFSTYAPEVPVGFNCRIRGVPADSVAAKKAKGNRRCFYLDLGSPGVCTGDSTYIDLARTGASRTAQPAFRPPPIPRPRDNASPSPVEVKNDQEVVELSSYEAEQEYELVPNGPPPIPLRAKSSRKSVLIDSRAGSKRKMWILAISLVGILILGGWFLGRPLLQDGPTGQEVSLAQNGDAESGDGEAGDDEAGDDGAGDDEAGDDEAGDDEGDTVVKKTEQSLRQRCKEIYYKSVKPKLQKTSSEETEEEIESLRQNPPEEEFEQYLAGFRARRHIDVLKQLRDVWGQLETKKTELLALGNDDFYVSLFKIYLSLDDSARFEQTKNLMLKHSEKFTVNDESYDHEGYQFTLSQFCEQIRTTTGKEYELKDAKAPGGRLELSGFWLEEGEHPPALAPGFNVPNLQLSEQLLMIVKMPGSGKELRVELKPDEEKSAKMLDKALDGISFRFEAARVLAKMTCELKLVSQDPMFTDDKLAVLKKRFNVKVTYPKWFEKGDQEFDLASGDPHVPLPGSKVLLKLDGKNIGNLDSWSYVSDNKIQYRDFNCLVHLPLSLKLELKLLDPEPKQPQFNFRNLRALVEDRLKRGAIELEKVQPVSNYAEVTEENLQWSTQNIAMRYASESPFKVNGDEAIWHFQEIVSQAVFKTAYKEKITIQSLAHPEGTTVVKQGIVVGQLLLPVFPDQVVGKSVWLVGGTNVPLRRKLEIAVDKLTSHKKLKELVELPSFKAIYESYIAAGKKGHKEEKEYHLDRFVRQVMIESYKNNDFPDDIQRFLADNEPYITYKRVESALKNKTLTHAIVE